MNIRDEIELCNLQDADDIGQLWEMSKRLLIALERIVERAPKNGEDVSYKIAKDAISKW